MIYFNWQKSGLEPGPPYHYQSPNVRALLDFALVEFGGYSLGIGNVRPITGGSDWSTHAFFAANDWGYLNDRNDARKGENRAMALAYIAFLIQHHEVLGVQMIVDEAYDRTWKVGRGWKDGEVSGGGSWLHIETHPDFWDVDTPIAERLRPTAPPTPPKDNDMATILDYKEPGTPGWTAFSYDGIHLAHVINGNAVAVQERSGAGRVRVNYEEMYGIIQSAVLTTACPVTLEPDLKTAWAKNVADAKARK